MPWQRMVADIGGELIEDPDTGLLIPAYRDVVFSTPRQSGKTTEVLAWECQRAIGWEHFGPQRISYSAQTGGDARKKLVNDQMPILKRHMRALNIRRTYEANGSEGVVWGNGSRLTLLYNTEAAGHGQTIDLGIKDELFADHDDRRDQALVPAMATKSAGQVVSCSTMGTEDSIPWNQLVEAGRLAVDAGRTTGIAYFEWSAADDVDLDDPREWWGFMPALGYTITEAVVSNAHDKLTTGEFVRAFGNRKTKADDRVIPETAWNAICLPTVAPVGDLTFSLDVNPERSAGAIVAASPGVAELVDFRLTTGWLVSRASELSAKYDRPLWVVDSTGPAASLIPDMVRSGLNVHPATPRELIEACGQFYDDVIERRLSLRTHQRFDEAAAGAAKRSVGDSWAWTRKNAAADISPLVAATLALWGAGQPAEPEEAGGWMVGLS